MTLRIDKDTADAIVNDNMVAGAAINWLRYMEISRSWTRINLDNLGELTMQATIREPAGWMAKAAPSPELYP
jgi:hypothetical protein